MYRLQPTSIWRTGLRRLALLFLPLLALRAESPRVCFIVGESEYRTWESLPKYAAEDLAPLGWAIEWTQSSNRDGDNVFTNVEAIARADLLVVSVRRRTPAPRMLELIRAHLDAGKPLAGLRTASHAFELRGKEPPAGFAQWKNIDRDVFGAEYGSHFGDATATIRVAAGAEEHPLLAGVPASFPSPTKLYRYKGLADHTRVLLEGRLEGQSESQPVAWTARRGNARIFYTSLGGPGDFASPACRRLLTNGLRWCLERDAP